jgi:hypothetical protein
MAGLLEAGVRFIEALSPAAASPQSAPTAAAGQIDGGPKNFVLDIIRTDPKTSRPMLTIPLPETVTAERIANAIGSLLRTFQPRG